MKQILFFLTVIVLCNHLNAQSNLWMGGSIGMSLPSNLGRSGDQIGFKDVAQKGFVVSYTGRWFYGKRLSLGWDIGWETHKANESFWDVGNYGDVTNNYNALHLLLEGNYYFSHKEIKPYCGVAFGAFMLSNNMTFDSAYSGTDADASASYKEVQWKPGFAPQAGMLFELSKNIVFDMKMSFVFIPNLEEKTQTIYQNNWPKTIVMNPHGSQHHWVISMGLLFSI